MIRRPAVAGQFYPADPRRLRGDLIGLTRGEEPPGEPHGVALMVPHAGYMYSGSVAARTYTSVALGRRFIILCPNHTGRGEDLAINDDGEWETPLGRVPIDTPLARALLEGCGALRVDDAAHRGEHSLEVQLPFLQHLVGGFTFVPLCVGTRRLDALIDLGRCLAEAIVSSRDEVLLIISSDMSHYVPASVAQRLDHRALERVVAVDPEGLHRVVLEEGIGMCGLAPAVAGLEAARRIGFRAARLVAYAHSGETTGDMESVVGYAGVAVT